MTQRGQIKRRKVFMLFWDECITSPIKYRGLPTSRRSVPNKLAWYIRYWNWIKRTHRMLVRETNRLLEVTDEQADDLRHGTTGSDDEV